MEQDFIFIKLSPYDDEQGHWSEQRVIDTYIADERRKGYTWFSTNSLGTGMKKQRVKNYNDAIRAGEAVRMFFAMNDENHGNDIAYSAQVLRVYSERMPVHCPEPDGEPEEFHGETNRIWIQICALKKERAIRASMLQFTNTRNNVKSAISHGQCCFGYVSLK